MNSVHGPSVSASHQATCHGAGCGLRLSTTTSCPPASNALARIVPTCPDPPGMTIFIVLQRSSPKDTNRHETIFYLGVSRAYFLINHPRLYRAFDIFEDLECFL